MKTLVKNAWLHRRPGVAGHPVNALDYAKISWLTASLATVGGALGAGLEDEDVVRAAAYTRSST